MTKTTLPATVSFDGTEITIVDHNGNAWIAARDLSAALGYSDERAISRIYSRHAKEFTDEMTCVVKLTPHQGQARDIRVFSPRGCYAMGFFARTQKAEAWRRWVLDVLEGIATPAPRAPKRLEKQQHDLPAPAPPAFNAELQERIYKRAGALSGLHYTWCVEQMNLQRHLPPVCFSPDTWTPEPHTPEVIADIEAALSVMEVFGKRLAAHHRHLIKLTANDKPSLAGMVADAKARRVQS